MITKKQEITVMQRKAEKQYMVASNVVTRSNFICIHTYYIHFLQYLTEQSEKVLSLTVNTSAILSRGSFLLSCKYTWFPTMINKNPQLDISYYYFV